MFFCDIIDDLFFIFLKVKIEYKNMYNNRGYIKLSKMVTSSSIAVTSSSIAVTSSSIAVKQRLHGTNMDFSSMEKLFPTRMDFISNSDIITKKINQKIPLRFMPNSVIERTFREKNGKSSKDQDAPGYYRICIAGVLTDGRKAIVMIENVLPHFYIKVPNQSTFDKTKSAILSLFKLEGVRYEGKLTKVHRKEFKYNADADFIKCQFRTLSYRNNALYKVRYAYDTVHNDSRISSMRSDYYNVVARDYIKSFSSWVEIKNYKFVNYDLFYMKIFRVDVGNYNTYEGDLDYESAQDKSIELGWDCETFSHEFMNGEIPHPHIKTDELFMIGTAIQYYDTSINTDINGNRIESDLDGELLNVVFSKTDCKPYPNKLTVICHNEKNIIRAFAILFKKIKPDFVCGFNDSEYDWKWFISRARSHGLIRFIEKHMSLIDVYDSRLKGKMWKKIDDYQYYIKDIIKLESTNQAESKVVQYFGYITIDVRTQFRMIHNTSIFSNLNYFLKINKLGSKTDMDYKIMFEIYKKSLHLEKIKQTIDLMAIGLVDAINIINILPNELHSSQQPVTQEQCDNYDDLCSQSQVDMAEVAEYCFVDALRCHELLKRRDRIKEKRAFATLTFTTLWSGLYQADGVKIRNLLIHQAQQMGILVDSTKQNKNAPGYPGAFVGFPTKGLISCKLSIEERISIANELEPELGDNRIYKMIYDIEMKHRVMHILWLYVIKDEVQIMYNFIKVHGATRMNCPEDDKIWEVIEKLTDQFDSNWHNEGMQHQSELDICIQNISEKYNLSCTSPASVCFIQFIVENNKYPVTSFDFKSLYPNVMRTWNLSPEKLIKTQAEADEAMAAGVNLQKVDFTHDGIHHLSWFVQHDNDIDKMGVVPRIINDLQTKRDIQKLPKTEYEHMKEVMMSNSMRTTTIKELALETYKHVNKYKKSGKKISMRDILAKYLVIDIVAVKRNGRV